MSSDYAYRAVHPQGFANRYTIYAAPRERAEELAALADRHCPMTGYVREMTSREASQVLWERPVRAYGWTPDDAHQPTEDEVSEHYATCTGRGSARSCRVCHPPRSQGMARLVERCEAEMGTRVA